MKKLTKKQIRKILEDRSIKIISDDESYGRTAGEITERARQVLINLIDYNIFYSNSENEFTDGDTTYTIIGA